MDYYNKYLKYKSKYLQLQNQKGGADEKLLDILKKRGDHGILLAELIEFLHTIFISKNKHTDDTQNNAHTPITEPWKEDSELIEIIADKGKTIGQLFKVSNPIPISAYSRKLDKTLVTDIYNGTIIVTFNKANFDNLIFPNFWIKVPLSEAMTTQFVYQPINEDGKPSSNPYAYHSSKYSKPGNLYRVIARVFTTHNDGEWISTRTTQDVFSKMVTPELLSESIPVRIIYI